MKRKSIIGVITVLGTYSLAGMAHAQDVLPDFAQEIIDEWQGTAPTGKVAGYIRLALTLAFGLVLLAAVFYSIIAAIRFITSQGESGKVEQANKAIKAIFQGVIAMFIGIIGVVVIFFVFDVALPSPSLPPVCVKYPESTACRVCSEGEKVGANRCLTLENGQRKCTPSSACDQYSEKTSFNL